jgi:four helix bundle protein
MNMENKKTHAKGFQDLEVYQKAVAIAQDIFRLTKTFPKEETYSLTDQVRRCSRSIGAQIAEAWLPARRASQCSTCMRYAVS